MEVGGVCGPRRGVVLTAAGVVICGVWRCCNNAVLFFMTAAGLVINGVSALLQ